MKFVKRSFVARNTLVNLTPIGGWAATGQTKTTSLISVNT